MELKIAAMTSLAGAMLLSACAQPSPGAGALAPDAAQVQSAVQSATPQCEPGKEAWRSSGPPKRGGTLVRGSDTFEHMDMTKPGRTSLSATPQVYNTLVRFRACFPSDTAMVPSLARSWEVSPDGRAWTFKLRDDVKWQNRAPVNGRAFTSADVGWMIDHQMREGVLQSYWEDVAHEEPDPHTVVLRLLRPQPDLLGKVGDPSNLMMPREIKEQYGDFKTVAVGTGAFLVKEFKPGQNEVLLQANPDYWEKGEDGKPLPYVDEVHGVGFGDYTTQLAALRAGRTDSTSTFGLRKLDADALRQSYPHMHPWEMLAFAPQALWFNLGRKPFDDVRVRKAVALAVDPEDLIAVNRGGAAHSGFIPASLVEWAWPSEKAKEKFKADPERARRLLAEAGITPGALELDVKTCTAGAEEAEVVQSQLQAVGFRSKLTVVPGACGPVQQRREYDLAWTGVGGVLFPGYWMGDFIQTGSSRNTMLFSDPQIDALAEAQGREMDVARRKQIIDQIQDRLYDLMPYYPPIARIFYHFASCRTRNYMQLQPGYNTPSPVYAWIDQAGC